MSLPGDVRVVDDVPRAFAALVVKLAPRSIALSGGNTARQCYELLADADVDWSRVDVFFGDERWVSTDDPDSNEHLARTAFLDKVMPKAVHSMRGAGYIVEAAADNYDRLVRGFGPIDIVHLGLGPDGHTASLFPGSPALEEQERYVVPNGDDQHPHPRLTFTYPKLASSRLAVFTVVGEEKRDAMTRIRAGDDLPAARVRAEDVLWLVDPTANA